jgi:hypothetical protein
MILQTTFIERSNFFEGGRYDKKYNSQHFQQIIELVINEIVAKNLIQHLNGSVEIESRRLQEMVVQVANTIKPCKNWEKILENNGPSFIEIQFERLHFNFTGLLELLGQKKFYLGIQRGH